MTILKPGRVAAEIAGLVWAQRNLMAIDVRHDEHVASGMWKTFWELKADLTLPSGMEIQISPDDHKVRTRALDEVHKFERYDAFRIMLAWRAVQAEGILRAMGEDHDPSNDVFQRGLIAGAMRRIGMRPPRREVGWIMTDALAHAVARRIHEGRMRREEEEDPDKPGRTRPGSWNSIGDGVRFVQSSRYAFDGDGRYVVVEHADWGHVEVREGPIRAIMERRRSEAFGDMIADTRRTPTITHQTSGNARIARIAHLCRDALIQNPDLADARGTRIAPLVDRHLPDLIRRHAAAAANAPVEQMTEIDSDLEKGIEIIRTAVEQALAVEGDARRDELRTQLRFLQARHPQDELAA